MRTFLITETMLVALCCSVSVNGATRYVDINNANATPPYTNWATAATVIQDAVDVALPGDEIVVTNGVYQSGGHALYLGMINRVAVTKPITVRSVNGPEVTVIRGYQVPGTTNGDGAVRCVYLTNGATLAGFTLTGGAVMGRVPLGPSGLPALTLPLDGHEFLSGGGVWCESLNTAVSNCVLTGNSAVYGGGAFSGTLNHCLMIENSAGSGGGAVRSSLNDCVLTGNSASLGGGALSGRLGGGAYFATLNRCSVSGNTAQRGGGVFSSTLTNCTVSGNTATEDGGGSRSSRLFNCILIGNTARFGGGAYGGTINNCTVVGNAASSEGGGLWAFSRTSGGFRGGNTRGCSPQPECHGGADDGSIMSNSIVYENTAPDGPDHFGFTGAGYENIFGPQGGKMDYSCTTPMPTNNIGNFTNAPLFVDRTAGNFRLQTNSPCINAGRNAVAPDGPDLDGNPRIVGGTVDIGAYEFQSPQSSLSYAWLQQFALPTDGSADFTDPDGDGHNNWKEWQTGSDPFDPRSTLRVSLLKLPDALLISWTSVSNRSYFLQRSKDLTLANFQTLATNIVGIAGTAAYMDTLGEGPFFYRVGVNE